MIDLHVHSEFSYDSDAKMLDYINRAKELGLKHLYFTDHVDMQPIDPGYLYYEPRAYFEEYWKLKRLVETNDFHIHSGIEFGEPHLYPENIKRLAHYHYDVIIGSIHYVGKLYNHPGLPDLRDAKDFYQEYWRDMLKTVANGGFDVLAHIDNPKRAYGYFTYEEKMLKNIFNILLDDGGVIEINTASLRKGYKETTPGRELLELYKLCGGQFVTIGSDAHCVEDLAKDTDKARILMKEMGLQEVMFIDRKIIIV